MKKILLSATIGIFGISCYSMQVPNVLALKRIYDIAQSKNAQFLIEFSDYEDAAGYGKLPNALNAADLHTLNPATNWSDAKLFQFKSYKKLYIAHVKNAFVSPINLGTFFDYQEQFLFDIVVKPGSAIFAPVGQEINSMRVEKHSKLATVQAAVPFYHWVIDRFPSILLMRDLIMDDPEIKLLINNDRPSKFVFEYLDLLGIPREKCIIAQPNILYFADTLYFATPFLMEPIPRKLLLGLRNVLIEKAKKNAMVSYANNLIIIIQRTEQDRRIQNIGEIVALFSKFFPEPEYKIIVYDANMSVADQIMLFNHAKIVFGVLSSGMTNVLYAKPGTHIIEVSPAAWLAEGKEWCWWLSSAIDAHYWVIPHLYNIWDTFVECPLNSVENILKEIKTKF